MSRHYDENLHESVLARSLANNHAYSTLGAKDSDAHKRVLKKHSLIQKYDSRVIVIVGSGASQDAGVPGTKEAISRLKKPDPRLDRPAPQLDGTDPGPDKPAPEVDGGPPLPLYVIERELNRLESVQKLDPSQFETLLLAMSATEYSGKVVRDRLVKIFNCRFMPTLPYEILAHLLKHKFIDAIISFNFDELLDQAISDELKSEEYYLILSDGDCPSSVTRDGVLDKPFYIKPHGTVSHSSTLRFTRDDYYRLPFGIQRIISKLLSDRPVDLISIGFNMKSFEFNLIANRAKEGSRIFYVNLEEPKPEPELDSSRFKSHWIPVDSKTRSLGKVLESICEKTSKHFQNPYGPRSIERHRLLSYLFEGESWERRDETGYLKDRTVIELALAIAKAKGFVMMSGLSTGRAGEYFRQHQKSVESLQGMSRQSDPKHEKSFINLCAALGLRDVAYGHESLRLTKNDFRPVIVPRNEFNAHCNKLFEDVRSNLTPARRGAFDEQKLLFKTTLLAHYDGAEVEVRAASAILHDNLFKTAKVLRSKTALNCHTIEMLENPRWQRLLLVSETGEWLESKGVKDAINRHPKREIFLIVADRSHEADLMKLYPGRIRIEEMFWWDHNRHLTLFLDRKGNELEGIYFTRQRRSTDIVPVRFDASDSRIVFEFWKAYWIRATKEKGAFVNRKRIEAFEFPRILPTPSAFAKKLATIAQKQHAKFQFTNQADQPLCKQLKKWAKDLGFAFTSCTVPWSALFVSWCVKQAGATNSEFRFAMNHSVFAHHAIQNGQSGTGVFQGFDIGARTPNVGDIIQHNCDGKKLSFGFAEANKDYASHSVIVVEIDQYNSGGFAFCIGGNESDSVRQTVVPLDSRGFIVPRADNPFICVIKNLK